VISINGDEKVNVMIDSHLIDLTKKRISKKKCGRFKVTIDTVAANDSLLVSYDITVEDFGNSDYVKVYNKHYNGSRPEKMAQEIIERIRGINIINTKSFYTD
jgi:putative transposon-encoded protein